MRAVWVIAREELRHALRQKIVLLWTFVMPPLFFAFIGSSTGGRALPSPDRSPALELRGATEAGFAAEALAYHLAAGGLELRDADAAATDATPAGARLELPVGMTEELLAGRPARPSLRLGGSGPASDLIELRVRRAWLATLADLAMARVDPAVPIDREGLERLHREPPTMLVESRPAGARRVIPSGYAQAVPGNLVMFTLLVLLTSGASQLLQDRRLGLLRRLASAPVSRGAVIFAKWAGRVALGWVQIGFAMVAGTLLFGVDWGDDLAMVLAVLAAWGAFCAAFAMLLGAAARTPGQVLGLGILSSMVLAALGGCWWPIEVAPLWMQRIQKLLPSGWTMDALHRLVHFGSGAASAVPHLCALLIATAVVGAAAARRLRFGPD